MLPKINSQITKGLHFQLPLEEINKLLPVIKSAMMGQTDLGLGPKSLGVIYENFLKQQIGMTQADKNISALQSEMNAKASQQLTTEQTIANIVLKKKDFLKLEQNIRKELQATGMSEVDVEKQILAFQEASGEFLTKDIELQKELVSHMQALEEIELRRARAKGLVDNQLEYLKLQGATALQLVQERIELEKMYGINQDRNSLLRNELELNKEITKEKLNQNSLSSTSLKLFQVSKQYGSQTATTISDFLANKIPVGAFEAAGKFSSLMPVLEKFFSSELEQRQANQFFFKGQGTEIPIPERRASSEFQPMSLGNIKLPDIKTDIGGITVQIKKLFSDNETSKQIIDSMLAAIRGDTGIKSAIDEQIEKF